MLPSWNTAGVIPPIRPNANGATDDRSPYRIKCDEFVEAMCVTAQRALILRGLLRYREGLYAVGLKDGFQWLDGSFCEEIEVIEGRAPRDIDAVTFVQLPQTFDKKIVNLRPDLFDKIEAKRVHMVDAHFVTLNQSMGEVGVNLIAYWYSMWSHRRDGLWKGFAEVPLSKDDDTAATAIIDAFERAL